MSEAIENFGLDDEEMLREAKELAPELFAALEIAKSVPVSDFPLESDEHIERVLGAVANEGGNFKVPGVIITPKAARDYFPNEFLPVTDRGDLVRKIYLAIVINHSEHAKRQVAKLERTGLQERISHPLPTELK